jgi:hypothetical protein
MDSKIIEKLKKLEPGWPFEIWPGNLVDKGGLARIYAGC